jgi:hypothetical protein
MKPKQHLLRLLIVPFAAMLLSTHVYCQSSKNEIDCGLVNAFLDSLEHDRWFHKLPTDSSLIFLDPDDLIKDCALKNWRGSRITVVKVGPIIDSIRHRNPHYVLNGQCEYFVFAQSHDKKEFYISLLQPCSNEDSAAEIKRRKGHYYIARIRDGVL